MSKDASFRRRANIICRDPKRIDLRQRLRFAKARTRSSRQRAATKAERLALTTRKKRAAPDGDAAPGRHGQTPDQINLLKSEVCGSPPPPTPPPDNPAIVCSTEDVSDGEAKLPHEHEGEADQWERSGTCCAPKPSCEEMDCARRLCGTCENSERRRRSEQHGTDVHA